MPTSPIPENTALLFVGTLTLILFLVIVVIGLVRRGNGQLRAALSGKRLVVTACISGLILAAVIAMLGTQNISTSASALSQANNPLPARQGQDDTTPTGTLSPSATPTHFSTATPQPSLTPTMSETPIILYTPIIYVSTYAMTTPTKCSVIAKTQAYLRGDPSEKMSSIGVIFAGSLLNVTGRVADTMWWQVISTTADGVTSIEGWVRADYVTADAACTSEAVPVIGPTETPTRALFTGSTGTSTATFAPCTVMTTIAASLRPDPSLQHIPLTQVPQGTTLTATEKSANGSWWHVTFGGQDGWIGAGAVLASAGCR
ncbi:MAG: SH3 domain-containing protein [Chloroflexota bacterium]